MQNSHVMKPLCYTFHSLQPVDGYISEELPSERPRRFRRKRGARQSPKST
jgi:hypothetical protein